MDWKLIEQTSKETGFKLDEKPRSIDAFIMLCNLHIPAHKKEKWFS